MPVWMMLTTFWRPLTSDSCDEDSKSMMFCVVNGEPAGHKQEKYSARIRGDTKKQTKNKNMPVLSFQILKSMNLSTHNQHKNILHPFDIV